MSAAEPGTGKKQRVLHERCLPEGGTSDVTSKSASLDDTTVEDAAINFPFELDPFQTAAIDCLHREESVLVAAHTSAGKTVVAQYAIALAIKHNQRVIYTTPIKALSNQKYRDLGMFFSQQDIGLMTGDVTVNSEANCIVMTTEILRSMLYHGSDELREVAWVIFDEVHYLRDKERGVVWEESIILLPIQIKLVFLSATIPNSLEFAQWVANLKGLPCNVVQTDFRPTPLQHFMFPAGGNGIFLILDEAGNFLEDNFIKMMTLQDSRAESKTKGKEQPDIIKLVSFVADRGMCPAIVFAFSRRECEALALQTSRCKSLRLVGESQVLSIKEVFEKALQGLAKEDQELPQIQNILPLLCCGIGVHHSGLLPILRELIEILFQEGLVKVLFATETFALGLNMPAKTCIFTNCRKFDGQDHRWISSGEYIQMAGRAGRRGIDDKGCVITMFDEHLEPETARDILCGQPSPLVSTFHLNYNMILNAMRSSGVDPEKIITKSFHQYQSCISVSSTELRSKELEAEVSELQAPNEHDDREAEAFCELLELSNDLKCEISSFSTKPDVALGVLRPGRVVKVMEIISSSSSSSPTVDWGWGVVLGFARRTKTKSTEESVGDALPPATSRDAYVLHILLPVSHSSSDCREAVDLRSEGEIVTKLIPCNWKSLFLPGGRGRHHQAGSWRPIVMPFLLSCVEYISTIVVDLPKDGNMKEVKRQKEAIRSMFSAVNSHTEEELVLDAHYHLSIADETVKRKSEQWRSVRDRMRQNKWWRMYRFISAGIVGEELAAFMRSGQEESVEESEPEEGEVLKEDALPADLIVDEDCVDEIKYLDFCIRRRRLHREIADLKAKTKKTTMLFTFKDELKKRMKVLRKLHYISEDNVVTIKGQAACQIEAIEDLVLSELIFHGAFNKATPAEIASFLTCVIAEEEVEAGHLQEFKLAKMIRLLQTVKEDLKKTEEEVELPVAPLPSTNTCLMDIVFLWCSGCSFGDICTQTSLFEGSVIRAMRREAELLRQMVKAAEAIGDKDLEEKFVETQKALQRGIPFSSSLYI